MVAEFGQPGPRSCRTKGGLFLQLALSGLKGAGMGKGPHSVSGGGWHDGTELAHGSPTHAPPPILGRMSSLGRHPCSHGDKPRAQKKLQAQPSMGTASTTPRCTGEPRNRAGEEEVGGARPPLLGSFHRSPASSVSNSLTTHLTQLGVGGGKGDVSPQRCQP